jgi:hypothetical protein
MLRRHEHIERLGEAGRSADRSLQTWTIAYRDGAT